MNYVFPPFALIPRVLQHIRECNVFGKEERGGVGVGPSPGFTLRPQGGARGTHVKPGVVFTPGWLP